MRAYPLSVRKFCSALAARVRSIMSRKLFEEWIQIGSLTLIEADGHSLTFGQGEPHGVMQLTHPRSLQRILRNPQMALGENYMQGGWTVPEGQSLHDLLTVIRLNLEEHVRRPGVLSGLLSNALGSWNSVATSLRNVRAHYDLDENLFRAFLDQELHYSCAYFTRQRMTLEQAQEAKCRHIASKLLVSPGHRVLDIGSGWGSLAIYLATHHDVTVTGLTLSQEQLRVARARAAAAGLEDRVRFELQDYRQHRGQYDRVVSVGMLEHVGKQNLGQYFSALRAFLAPDGVAMVHSIANMQAAGRVNPWIRRYIFPGGYIPDLVDLAASVRGSRLRLTDLEVWRDHYAQTLSHWFQRFQYHRSRFLAERGEAFCRMWEFYLALSQTAFEVGGLAVYQLQITSEQASPVPVTRDYLYR